MLAIVGESPGEQEDARGRPFIGPSGALIRRLLNELSIKEPNVVYTNAVRCYTPGKVTDKSINRCRDLLLEELEAIKPDAILSLGAAPLKSLCGVTGITKERGIPRQVEGRWVIPTFHPAFYMRGYQPSVLDAMRKDMAAAWRLASSGQATPLGCQYEVLYTDEDLWRIKQDIVTNAEYLAWDIETTGLNPYNAGEIVCVQFSWKPQHGVLIPLHHSEYKDNGRNKDFIKFLLSDLCANKLIGHNLKFDTNWVFKKLGFEPKRPVWDTMVAEHLIDENGSKRLKNIVWKYTDLGGYEKPFENESGDFYQQMYDVPLEKLKGYAVADTDAVFRVHEKQRAILEERGQIPTLELEMRKLYWVIHLERAGTCIDWEYQAQAEARFEKEIERRLQDFQNSKVIKDAKAILKQEDFNINSSPQMQKLITEVFKLKPDEKYGYTETGQVAVGRKQVDAWTSGMKAGDWRKPVLEEILQIKRLQKLLSTYIKPMPGFKAEDNRIHPSFHPAYVTTWRFSSSEPNVQNWPRSDEGEGDISKGAVKRMIVPPHEDWTLVEMDYSQAELRLAALISQDEEMLRCYAEGIDLHKAMATQAFQTSFDAVTKEQRTLAKIANFGIIYGISPPALAQQAKTSIKIAEMLVDSFYKKFPGFKRWNTRQRQYVLKYQESRSLFGHVRHLPDVRSTDRKVSEEAVRQGCNFPIQCTASNIGIYAGYAIQRRLTRNGLRAYTFNQVHDSIWCATHRDDLSQVCALMRQVAENMPFDFLQGSHPDFPKTVPMLVDLKTGPTMSDLEEYHETV